MNPFAIVGALVGGAVGAALWAAVTYFTHYEVGYVAWAVGLLAGYGAVLFGGRGKVMGVAAALVALAAIVAGKAATIYLVLPSAIREVQNEDAETAAALSVEAHAEWVRDAEAFAKLTSADQHAQFMVDHAYTEAERAEDVDTDDLAGFRGNTAPLLEELHRDKLDHPTWRARVLDTWAREAQRSITLGNVLNIVRAELSAVDILFAALGLFTAYRLCAGQASQVQPAADAPVEDVSTPDSR